MILWKILIDSLLGLLFFIDNVVYGFIPTLYKLMLYLADINLVSDNIPVQALIQRLYILVGVFMLFRLSFSIMNYIVDPDAFSDKSKGFTNLVKRVLIVIVLLVSIPWIFSKLYVVQRTILTSNILPRLVLGETVSNDSNKLEENIETSARDVQFLVFGPFFSLNYNSESGDLADCKPSKDNPASNILGTNGMAQNDACMGTVAGLMDGSPDVVSSGINIKDFFRYKDDGGDKRKFDSFGGLISWTLSNGDRAINYLPIASTLCGGYLVFLLLSFCIDVAARVIRLLFLQILSPVAVISSIDPTSSGDRLKEWAKECLKVWLSLFLRLLVIFLIIQLVRVITNTIYGGDILNSDYSNSIFMEGFIYVFLVLGIFQAAKNIPELIEKATGIKMSGELQLNPFKALSSNVGVGLLAAGGAALGAGITNLGVKSVGDFLNSRRLNEDGNIADQRYAGFWGGARALGRAARRGIFSSVGGAFGAGRRGVVGAMHGEGPLKNMRSAYGTAMFARQQREDLNRQGSTWHGRLMADVERNLGIMNAAQRQELDYARSDNALKDRQSQLDFEKSEVARIKNERTRDFRDYSSTMSSINDIISNDTTVKNAQAKYDEAVRTGVGEAEAKRVLDAAKRKTWEGLLDSSTDYGRNNHDLVQAYINRLDELRRNNQIIQTYAPISDFEGNFDKSSMYAAQNEVSRIEFDFANGIERTQANLEAELSRRRSLLDSEKSTSEWHANELDNSSRGVKSPQPEGWKPSGEISGAYGPQYGPGVWGGGPGHPPGPGGRP